MSPHAHLNMVSSSPLKCYNVHEVSILLAFLSYPEPFGGGGVLVFYLFGFFLCPSWYESLAFFGIFCFSPTTTSISMIGIGQ